MPWVTKRTPAKRPAGAAPVPKRAKAPEAAEAGPEPDLAQVLDLEPAAAAAKPAKAPKPAGPEPTQEAARGIELLRQVLDPEPTAATVAAARAAKAELVRRRQQGWQSGTDLLRELAETVEVGLLKRSGVGVEVSQWRRAPGEDGRLASELVAEWKRMVVALTPPGRRAREIVAELEALSAKLYIGRVRALAKRLRADRALRHRVALGEATASEVTAELETVAPRPHVPVKRREPDQHVECSECGRFGAYMIVRAMRVDWCKSDTWGHKEHDDIDRLQCCSCGFQWTVSI